MGRSEKLIIETCIKRGQPLPQSLQNAPELYLGLGDYYSAFWQLSTDRPVGMVVGQIPWSSIDRYAQRNEMDDYEFERFEYLIRRMDEVWLDHNRPKKDG